MHKTGAPPSFLAALRFDILLLGDDLAILDFHFAQLIQHMVAELQLVRILEADEIYRVDRIRLEFVLFASSIQRSKLLHKFISFSIRIPAENRLLNICMIEQILIFLTNMSFGVENTKVVIFFSIALYICLLHTANHQALLAINQTHNTANRQKITNIHSNPPLCKR